jgi:molecular chaperone DnaK
MTDEEKESVESSLTELKTNLEDESTETELVRKSMDALIAASQAMATRLYQQAAQAQAAQGESDTPDEDDDIVEAEIVDDDEDDDEQPVDEDS